MQNAAGPVRNRLVRTSIDSVCEYDPAGDTYHCVYQPQTVTVYEGPSGSNTIVDVSVAGATKTLSACATPANELQVRTSGQYMTTNSERYCN